MEGGFKMNKLSWGSLIILLASLVLSLELYALTFLAEIISFDPESLLRYNDLIKGAVGVMCGLIVYGVMLVLLHFLEVHKKDKYSK